MLDFGRVGRSASEIGESGTRRHPAGRPPARWGLTCTNASYNHSVFTVNLFIYLYLYTKREKQTLLIYGIYSTLHIPQVFGTRLGECVAGCLGEAAGRGRDERGSHEEAAL